jgi:hypothetical protein
MYKQAVSLLFASISLVACGETGTVKQIDTEKTIKATPTEMAKSPAVVIQKELYIDGKYKSNEGDLELLSSKDKTNTHFSLLVVNSEGRTGDVEGDFTTGDDNKATYTTESCTLQFEFSENTAIVTQEGSCDMGLNVNASGTYKKPA